MASDWVVVLVGATTALGALAGTWLTGRRTLEAVRTEQQGRLAAEQAERDARRATERAERRRAFQFETLLALQDAIAVLGRTTGELHMANVDEARKGIPVRQRRPGSQVAEAQRQALLNVRLLRSRVMDDELRAQVVGLEDACFWTPIAETEDDARATWNATADLLHATTQAAGDRLRALD